MDLSAAFDENAWVNRFADLEVDPKESLVRWRALRDLPRRGGIDPARGQRDRDLVRAFADENVGTYEFLIENGVVSLRSTAVLKIARRLSARDTCCGVVTITIDAPAATVAVDRPMPSEIVVS